ncbi:MAG: SPFH domain-containing protein [Myxococcales bacterium]|nr:SPFH domain-containing protein [Myxococcales bacterium]
MRKLVDWFVKSGPVLWGSLAAIVTAGMLTMSVVDIEPGMAAVRINNFTGRAEAVTQPGWTTRIPYMHSVYLLDASPQTFKMEGDTDSGPLHVRELTVRASDGSNFHFDDTTIIFQLKPEDATIAVRDSGTGDRFQSWLKPYSRAILRDEFGRESTIAVSDPTTYAEATNRAKDRLNEVFANHGIVVTQLVTPRPKFNAAYEAAIEKRNALGNQQQVIRSDLDRAGTERERRLAVVDQEQNNEIQQRRASLESDLARAISGQAQSRREVDSFRIEKIAEGQAALSASTAKAEQLKGELNAKYVAKKAEIDAFRNQPVQKVMQRLGERLEGVTIHIDPYADDATPSRVRYEESRP